MGAWFSRHRYMGGKRLQKFFREDILPTIKNLLLSLHIQESHCFQIFKVFAIIDENENGYCDQKECVKYFGGRRTKFTDRIFFCEIIEEMDDNGEDDSEGYQVNGKKVRTGYNFREFLIVVWSFCTLNHANMARYIFEIFDVDDIQILYRKHICAMFQMIFDEDKPDDEYIDLFEFNEAQQITKHSFIERCCQRTEFMQPALAYQSLLRKKLGGILIWELLTQARSRYLSLYDDQNRFLSEAVEDMLKTKLEILETKQILKTSDGILQDTTLKLEQSIGASKKELELRVRQVKNEQKALQDVSRDRYMRDAWQTFFNKREQFADEEFTTDVKDMMRRKKMRDDLYNALDQAMILSDEFFQWKDDYDLNFAIGTDGDHQARFEDFLKLKEGRWLQELTYLMHLFKILQEQCVKKYGTSSVVSDLYAKRAKENKKEKDQDKKDPNATPRRRNSLLSSLRMASWRSNNSSSKIAVGDDDNLENSLRRAAQNAKSFRKNVDDNSTNSASNVNNNKSRRFSRRDRNEKPQKQVIIEANLLEIQKLRTQLVELMSACPFKLSEYENLSSSVPEIPGTSDSGENDSVLFQTSTQAQTPMQAILKKAYAVANTTSTSSKKVKKPNDDDDDETPSNTNQGHSQNPAVNKPNGITSAIYESPEQKKEKFLQYLEERGLAEEIKQAKRYASKNDIHLADRQATIQMKEELKARTIDATRQAIALHQKERQKEYKRKEFDIATKFGSRNTKWEYLLEKDRNRYFYVNRETLQVRHPKTAICEFCDAIFVQHELRCTQCDRPRSTKNIKLYRPLGFKDITAEHD